MRIRGIGRVRRVVRWFVPSAVILLYHRVVDSPSADPFLLSVTQRHFAEHVEVLREHGDLMQVHELAKAFRNGKPPRRAAAITFDDGYANNLTLGKPILARYDAHATVFVTTGYVGKPHEFWWDELERLFLQSGVLPDSLHLAVDDRSFEWHLGDATNYSQEQYSQHASWDIRQNDPGPRQHLYRSIYQLLRPLADHQRRRVLDRLCAWARAEAVSRETHRALTPDELIELAAGGLIEIGGHTVTHPALAELPPDTQHREIRESRTHLEMILGEPVTSFAYPYGSARHYSQKTVALVQEAGFESACSGISGLVWRGADTFQLRRMTVRDWDGEAFKRQLYDLFAA